MRKLLRPVILIASVGVFLWPILITTSLSANFSQVTAMVVMPALLLAAVASLNAKELDTKTIAVLGVLIALNAALRTLGAGTAGLETAFFVILIGGFALGPSLGFLLGAGSLLTSALVFGGLGPWLAFQMMAAGILGFLAGCLPHPKTRKRQALLIAGAAVPAAYLYGALLSLWIWPLTVASGQIAYLSGADALTNLQRFFGYELLSGGLLWDTGRAVTTACLVLLTAPALLNTLERALRKAGLVG